MAAGEHAPGAIPSDPNDPDAVLRDARQRFIASFPQQCDSILVLIDTVAGVGPGGPVPALRQLVHRMTGLAGTIGFPTVSARCAELESTVTEASDASLDRALAHDMLAAVREAFARDLNTPPDWASAAAAVSPGAARILVVEDDDDQRAIVISHLRSAGHAAVGVPAGDQALEAARAHVPAVILLDVDLPGLDGYSVCRLLKADPDLAPVPVVFMTARAGIDDKFAGLTLGADEFLRKPLDMRELVLRIRLLLGRRRPAPAPDAGTPAPARPEAPAAAEPELGYEAFLTAARDVVAQKPVSLVLVRLPGEGQPAAVQAIRDEIRRRDYIGRYDRGHLVLLMPDLPMGTARDRLTAVIERLRAQGLEGIAAGVAGSPAAGATLETLLADADRALTEARYTGAPASLPGEQRAGRQTAAAGTVVVAEDDPEVTRILDTQMRAAGYRTVLAFDGEQALAAVARDRPQALVLDLMMPKLTGFDVLARLREQPEIKPGIVVLSARGREDDVTRAFELGADDYMTKPFSPQELLARVARLLR